MKACVIGGGSWGSAFALHLGRIGFPTRLWIREKDVCARAVRTGENDAFLPGFLFPEGVTFHHRLSEALEGAEIAFLAVPSEYFRTVVRRVTPLLRGEPVLVSLTKGIEKRTLRRMTQILAEVPSPLARPRFAVLSGPSFAKEVALGRPAALVLASAEPGLARDLQARLSGGHLRIYASGDVVGVEIAGALKNVIAIAAGLSDAMDFGTNARAALITRGLAEIRRLGIRLGAFPDTFSGLAGMGDLVLTCTGPLSRNRFVGQELGRGCSRQEIIRGMRTVAEGIPTTVSARSLARRAGVELPITDQVHAVLFRNKDPRRALADLMTRTLKDEPELSEKETP